MSKYQTVSPLSSTRGLLRAVATPTKQQLVDYANAAAAINLYAYAITNQNMPVLTNPPSNYGSFSQQFAPAKAHCLDWTNSIFPTILSFPQTIINANNLFGLEDTLLGDSLQILQSDPTNQKAKTTLSQALSAMQGIVKQQLATGQQLSSSLTTFGTDITNDAKTLATIAQQSLADVKVDQDLIQQDNDNITSLNNQIKSLNTLLTVSEIGIGLSIFVGLIGAVVCFIPGATGVGVGIIVVAVAGLGASIAGTVILNKEIQADQNEISSLQTQIQGLNQDVILLQGLNTQFQALITANTNAQKAMQVVVQMWQNLDDAISAVIADLGNVSTDVTAAQYAQAAADLATANAAWQELVAFATALNGVNYNWIDQNGNVHSFSSAPPPVNQGQVTNIRSTQGLSARA